MLVGTHVSVAGGLDKAPANGKKVGAEVIQIFSRSPRGGPAPIITAEVVKKFQQACQDNKIEEVYIHTPYYINLASTNHRIRYGSIAVIREELERGSKLGVKYVMTHLGSANDLSRDKAVKQTIEGIVKILNNYKGSAQFLIENSAGAGNIIGDTFEEIAEIIKKVETKKSLKGSIGVCFDTCHAFASGYDLRTAEAYENTIRKFGRTIGLRRLRLFHLNDSKTEFDSHKDRHEHIGKGMIGKKVFELILNDRRFKNINACLETPADDKGGDISNIRLLKRLRKG